MAKGKSALALALKKKIGSNDEIQKVTHWIDTGFPPLNKAISGRYDGGFPCGRIVEVFGPPSAGKCVTADTMLLTERGMVTVKELFEIEGYKATCTTRDVEHNVGLINENGVIEKTSHLTWNNRRKFKRIKLASGGYIEATFRHPIRVVDDLGNVVWRHAEKISVGDTIPSMVGTHQFGDQHLDANIAKLMGYLIADGYVASENSVNFSNTDPFIKDEYYRLISLVSDKMPVTRKHNGSEDHVLFSKEVRSLLFKEYGLEYEKAAGKQVPLSVRRANSEAQIAFLRGYFELECHVNDGRCIEVVSASGLLLQQIRLMLLNLGITSTISEKHVAGYENTYYRLSFSGSNYDLFLSTIGFESPARLSVATKRDIGFDRTYSGYVPHISGLVKSLYESLTKTTREDYALVDHVIGRGDRVGIDKLREIYVSFIGRKNRFNEHLFAQLAAVIGSNLFYDEVVAIEEGEAPTFDVAMPETHSFWSNGIISHNTFLATAAMISAQKQDGLAVFLDHENSFDVGLAVANGLNADEDDGQWVYKQPDTFEDSVELIGTILKLVRDEELIPETAPICIVADSLASMVPNSKAEKFDKMAEGTAKDKDQLNMNDNTALARATSANFPTLALWARKYNACIIFLNQVRTKIGVMFGDPTTSPGGDSPKFYASVRIRLGASVMKDGKEKIGQDVGAECIKNKVAPPYGKCTGNSTSILLVASTLSNRSSSTCWKKDTCQRTPAGELKLVTRNTPNRRSSRCIGRSHWLKSLRLCRQSTTEEQKDNPTESVEE
ncbi:LAGLIDADG family homing endonuclease [Escherichia coli]|uniref:LAGLIDADG family homing endonuclease n=1 Tax=Escherichia coli TaxID=562 RepID=UPI00294A2B44|nr:LAGLIDADG family homing endonuclease [Escherichia coli]MDV5495375.1 LAGLIDADG family homing endonuclease [Escherichia coli]